MTDLWTRMVEGPFEDDSMNKSWRRNVDASQELVGGEAYYIIRCLKGNWEVRGRPLYKVRHEAMTYFALNYQDCEYAHPLSDWDHMFMAMAVAAAGKSKDPRTKVGAILVSPDKRTVSLGFNGFPAPIPDDIAVLAREKDLVQDPKVGKDDVVIHAEMNALLNCHERPQGWTIYVTHAPCVDCAKHIIASGVTRVVHAPAEPTTKSTSDLSGELFSQAGIEVIPYERHR